MSSTYPYSRTVAEQSPLDFPAVNGHVLITGSSGVGKSFFASKLFPSGSLDGLLLFKPDSYFRSSALRYASFEVRKDSKNKAGVGLPWLFDFRSWEVASAYLYSLHLDFSGIMAASLVPVFVDVFQKSEKNMEEFYRLLALKDRDRVVSGVSSLISLHFKAFYGFPSFSFDEVPVPVRKANQGFRFMSFEGLGTMNQEFGAELMLRNVYSRVGSSVGTVLVDEFHHVARAGSILDTLLREMRVSGRLVGVTQSLSDVVPSMLNNFGIVLVGRSVHPGDMDFLGRLGDILPGVVSGLPRYCFLSLHEYLSTGRLAVYRWSDE